VCKYDGPTGWSEVKKVRYGMARSWKNAGKLGTIGGVDSQCTMTVSDADNMLDML
jgi:hypothetical protein